MYQFYFNADNRTAPLEDFCQNKQKYINMVVLQHGNITNDKGLWGTDCPKRSRCLGLNPGLDSS